MLHLRMEARHHGKYRWSNWPRFYWYEIHLALGLVVFLLWLKYCTCVQLAELRFHRHWWPQQKPLGWYGACGFERDYITGSFHEWVLIKIQYPTYPMNVKSRATYLPTFGVTKPVFRHLFVKFESLILVSGNRSCTVFNAVIFLLQ